MDRQAWRAHPLDGAMLYFQPASGLHVRVACAATTGMRRRAPRVAMFGITNACNLACEFCSRDTARASMWTVADAADVLRGLAAAGTLEVAYGGGEPFAFRGFAELVGELDATTALAQHVTTNGTLIRASTWAQFAGRFGHVRISMYDQTWRAAAEVLAAHGQRWGANVLVDDRALDTLPAQLADLAAFGASDVSLLSYVGPDDHRRLGHAGRERLAQIIADSPLPCRLSVCLGDRVPVPRLFDGADGSGDCGAGRDFISITPDRRVQSCSFQDRSLPGTTSDEILAMWRTQQAVLAAPSPRGGCARMLPLVREQAPPPSLAVWQAFSGNNSGECVVAATFTTTDDAEAFLAELVPAWTRDMDAEPAWRALLAAGAVEPSDIDDVDDGEALAIGRLVLARTYAAEDPLRGVRARAWQAGAHVSPGGVHLHDGFELLAAVRAHDDVDAGALATAQAPEHAVVTRHGQRVFVALPVLDHRRGGLNLAAARDQLLAYAEGRAFAVEPVLAHHDDDTTPGRGVLDALTRFAYPTPQRERLLLVWWGEDRKDKAAAFAASLSNSRVVQIDQSVLVDPTPDRKRLAVLGYQSGAYLARLDEARIRLWVQPWFEPPPARKGHKAEPRTFDAQVLATTLRAIASQGTAITVEPLRYTWRSTHRLVIETDEPLPILRTIAALVDQQGARCMLGASDLDPIGATIHRLANATRPGNGRT